MWAWRDCESVVPRIVLVWQRRQPSIRIELGILKVGLQSQQSSLRYPPVTYHLRLYLRLELCLCKSLGMGLSSLLELEGMWCMCSIQVDARFTQKIHPRLASVCIVGLGEEVRGNSAV